MGLSSRVEKAVVACASAPGVAQQGWGSSSGTLQKLEQRPLGGSEPEMTAGNRVRAGARGQERRPGSGVRLHGAAALQAPQRILVPEVLQLGGAGLLQAPPAG